MGRVPLGAAAAPPVFTDRQHVLSRVAGVLRHPRETMARVAHAPQWLDVLVLSGLAAGLALGVAYGTDAGRLALVDQWERTAAAFGRPLDDVQYRQLLSWSEHGAAYGVGIALLQGPLATVAVSVLLFAAFGAAAARPRFVQVLAVASHAGVLLALRHMVAAPVTYLRETTANVTSLGVWFPLLEEGSGLARFLGLLDLFILWWAVVLAIGVARLYGRPARRVAGAFVGVYVGLATVLAAVMATVGGPG